MQLLQRARPASVMPIMICLTLPRLHNVRRQHFLPLEFMCLNSNFRILQKRKSSRSRSRSCFCFCFFFCAEGKVWPRLLLIVLIALIVLIVIVVFLVFLVFLVSVVFLVFLVSVVFLVSLAFLDC